MASTGKKFEDIVVGGDGCPKSEVAAVIADSKSFGKLHEKWKTLARYLGLPDHTIRKLADDYLLEIRVKTLEQLVDELLSLWKAEKGEQATLLHLCDAFKKCGLNDIAQSLSSIFGSVERSKNGKFSVNDLLGSRESKKVQEEKRMKRKWKIQGLPKFLQGTLTAVKIPHTYFFQKNVFQSKDIPFVNENLIPPTQPKYYIPRTLSFLPSTEIDTAIFSSESTRHHIFLFKDANKSDIVKLTRHKSPIELSGKQLYNATARFILLECEDDYDRICKITTKPVHMFQYKTPVYFWVKSNAATDVIKSFLKEPAINLKEQDLVVSIACLTPPCALSIADSPGMGKTLVMANLVRKIQEQNCSNTIHLFIVLQEFVKEMKPINSSSSAIEAIALYSCSDQESKTAFAEMLKNFNVYLFMDGYDEVMQGHLDLLDSFFKLLQPLKNVKIMVTSRPHLQTRLEVVFSHFSYEIQPFSGPNQIEFLTRYWVDQHGATKSENLELFAHQCLEALETKFTDKERDIAGIPLQCMMLAEVFSDDAKRACKLKSVRPNSVEPITLFQMYEKLVNLKFKRLSNESFRKNYLLAHVYEAVKVLFPEWIDAFEQVLTAHDKIDETFLYSIGLMEKSSSSPRFVHRTFAEYLLAEFIVSNLGKHHLCVDMFFWEIFGRKGTIVGKVFHFSQNYELKYPVIGYFIDMHMKQRSINEMLRPVSISAKFNEEDACITVASCSANDLEAAMDYSINMIAYRDFWIGDWLKHQYFKFLPHLVAERSNSVRILEKIFEFTKQQFGVDSTYHVKKEWEIGDWFEDDGLHIHNHTPLHVAVMKGNYNMAMWLVQHYGDQVVKFERLLHACVYKSAGDADAVVEEKLLIIDMLVEINPAWLEEEDDYLRTPLLQENVHLKLLQKLVEHGADINAYDCRYRTVLDSGHDEETYADVVLWALAKGFVRVNQTLKWITPLIQAIFKFKGIENSVVELLHKAGVDLNAEDNNGNSVLFYALEYSGEISLIKKLIELGADVNHKNKTKENALHKLMQNRVASPQDKLIALDMLVGLNRGWMLEENRYGLTPVELDRTLTIKYLMDQASNVYTPRERVTILNTILRKKPYAEFMHAVENLETVDDEVMKMLLVVCTDWNEEIRGGDSVLFHALEHSGSVDFIGKLLGYGADVNYRNENGENALHKEMRGRGSTGDKLAIIDMLVAIKPDLVNERDYMDGTPLIVEYKPDLRLLQRLVELGSDINAYSDYHGTVLHSRINSDNYAELVRWAFSKGFTQVNHKGEYGRTPLMYAIKHLGTVDDEVLRMFHEAGADMNAQDGGGDSVLFYAVKKHSKNVDLIRKLVELGADVNHRNKRNESVLHKLLEEWKRSTEANNADNMNTVLQLLHEAGADINAEDEKGNSVMLVALQYSGNIGLINKLIELGADIKHKNNYGQNALHKLLSWSKMNETIEDKLATLDMLVGMNRSWMEEKDTRGCTPLLQSDADVRLLSRLLELGADVNAHSSELGTVLHRSGRISRFTYTASLAFSYGFNLVNYIDEDGRTPIMHAIKEYKSVDDEVLKLFQDAGTDWNAEDNKGNSVLFYALEYSKSAELIKKLIDLGADVSHTNNENENIIHVLFRINHSPSSIKNQMLIIDMLVEINAGMLEKRNKNDCTPLLLTEGDALLLKHIVGKSADINAHSSVHGTILHIYWYILKRDTTYGEYVRWAFSNGLKLVNHTDREGRTPLMKALARYETIDDEVLRLFVEAGANLNAQDNEGDSVLFYAVRYAKNDELIPKLLKHGADVNLRNDKKQNLLHEVVRAEKLEERYNEGETLEIYKKVLELLVTSNRDLLEERDENDCTPLLQPGDLILLERLVEHGAEINAYSEKYGTVLHWEHYDMYKYTELVKLAFSKGFTLINHTDEHGRTPLMYAIKVYGDVDDEVLKMFHEAGANFNAIDSAGDSVLFYAIEYSEIVEFIEKILEYGADVQYKNDREDNAAHKVMKSRRFSSENLLEALKLLESKGFVRFHEKNSRGYTPKLSRNQTMLDERLKAFFRGTWAASGCEGISNTDSSDESDEGSEQSEEDSS